MNIFVLLYNSGTDKEGIHSIELKGRTIVLMFEDKDDAIRYCGLLEAQDFPLPTVEMINLIIMNTLQPHQKSHLQLNSTKISKQLLN